jgi:triosephosphate isomerase
MTLTNTKPFIAGNWKMHKTVLEAASLVKGIHEAAGGLQGAEIVVIPPYTALGTTIDLLRESRVQTGAQNLFWEEQGAFTGEISPLMLKDMGCSYVLVGHSERRQYFGETNETVNIKIKAALQYELTPILCIGESLSERKKNRTIAKVDNQIEEGLEGLDKSEVQRLIIAYEPIWAIGTGLTATPEQAQEVHGHIRDKLTEKYGNETGSCGIILYGGSVNPANTYELLKENDINGALVGGASLKVDSFTQIVKEAIRAYKEK